MQATSAVVSGPVSHGPGIERIDGCPVRRRKGEVKAFPGNADRFLLPFERKLVAVFDDTVSDEPIEKESVFANPPDDGRVFHECQSLSRKQQ